MTCPGCIAFLCDDCAPKRNAPYFARMTRREIPEGWPTVGYREKQQRQREGKMVEVTVTVSAHDLIIRMLEQVVRDGRAEHEREMVTRVEVREGYLS